MRATASSSARSTFIAVRPGGFEPPTNSLEGCCSIHLSYGRVMARQQLTVQGCAAALTNATTSAKLNAPLPRRAGQRAHRPGGAALAGNTTSLPYIVGT